MSRPATIASALAMAAGVFTLYCLRLDTAAGLIVDDAWYVVLAKSLAEGHGFRLVSSAVTQIMPAVPPGYPLILAPIFIASPSFPANVLLLKFVSVVAMMGVGSVVYRYLVTQRDTGRPMAAAIAVATVLTPALVFLATSTLMAECVFTLGQVLTVLALARVMRAEHAQQRDRRAVATGVVAAATMLVRTAGAATLLAGFVFLIKERAYRQAAAYVIAAAVCLAPWTIYSISHAPTAAQIEEHGGTIAFAYSDWFGMNRPGDASLGNVHAGDLAARAGRNVVNVFGRDVGGMLVPAFFRGAAESGEEVVSLGGMTGFIGASMGSSPVTMTIALVLSLVVAVGFLTGIRRRVMPDDLVVLLTLAVVLNVPARTFRYVLPLTPFVLFYFASGTAALASAARASGATAALAARVAVLCLIGLHIQDHAQYIAMKLRGAVPPDWLGDAQAANELTGWMNANLGGADPVASTNPGLVYLLTGRKAVATDEYSRGWSRWQAAGVRYVVALRPLALPPKALKYRMLYQSPQGHFWLIEIEPS